MKLHYIKTVETIFEIGVKYTILDKVFPTLIDFIAEQTFIAGDCWDNLTDYFTPQQVNGGTNHTSIKNITPLSEWGTNQRMTLLVDWGNEKDSSFIIIEKKDDTEG